MSRYSQALKIHRRMGELSAADEISDVEQAEFDHLSDELDALLAADRAERRTNLASGVHHGRYTTAPGTTSDDDDDRRARARSLSGERSGALRTLDKLVSADRLPARAAQTVDLLTHTGSGLERSWSAKVVEAVGSDSYESAFAKLVSDPQRGHLLWTSQEQAAFQRVEGLRNEMRSMSTTDVDGGYLVPLTIDPSVQISSDGSISPLRDIARVVQTVTTSWRGLTSAGVTASFDAENEEVSDDSPTLGEVEIPVYRAQAFIPASIEITMDAIDFTAQIGKLLTDGYQQLSNQAFTTGSGVSNTPTGLITALVGAGSPVVQTSATTDTFANSDVYHLQDSLGPRFQGNAQWAANLSILNKIRQFQTQNGSLAHPSMMNTPPTLLGRPANELSNMSGVITATQDNPILVYGSFEQFVIVDRWPARIELIPHLFGANRRPTGSRGFYLFGRVGSDVLVPQAFRLLNVT